MLFAAKLLLILCVCFRSEGEVYQTKLFNFMDANLLLISESSEGWRATQIPPYRLQPRAPTVEAKDCFPCYACWMGSAGTFWQKELELFPLKFAYACGENHDHSCSWQARKSGLRLHDHEDGTDEIRFRWVKGSLDRLCGELGLDVEEMRSMLRRGRRKERRVPIQHAKGNVSS